MLDLDETFANDYRTRLYWPHMVSHLLESPQSELKLLMDFSMGIDTGSPSLDKEGARGWSSVRTSRKDCQPPPNLRLI